MKLRRTIKELIHGEKTYLPKKKKQVKTTRTSGVESMLKQAGITETEMKKLRRTK